MVKYIGVKELRLNMGKYASHVKRGDDFIVMKHNRPMFKLSRVTDPWGDEGEWETVVDLTKIRKGGVPAEDVLSALKSLEEEDRKK
jgi:antitoxin (DNA-binding transcriptional repressor) of toxin-antitoxin stability system